MTHLYQATLFLGFSIDPSFKTSLRSVNPHLVSLLTSGGDYLQKISTANQEFLGKTIPDFPNFEELESLETHLISLLKKLAPQYPFHTNPPKLFAYTSKT